LIIKHMAVRSSGTIVMILKLPFEGLVQDQYLLGLGKLG